MTPFQTSPELIATVAGVALSLLFSYVPGLSTWYAALTATLKSLIMLVLLVIVTGAIYALGCGGILDSGLTCDTAGLTQLAWMFVMAAIANQATYKLSPYTQAVKDAKGE
jgi:hypothetical protein